MIPHDRRSNCELNKAVLAENLSITNIMRKISEVTGSEAFGEHIKSQLKMQSKKKSKIHDTMQFFSFLN